MIYVLFGEMGIGKNYVGERLAEHLDCIFFDGDDVLPPDLKEKVARMKPLTHADVNRFVTNHLIPGIRIMANLYGGEIVVAQALYMRKHRQQIVDALGGPDEVKLIHLPSPSFLTHMGRLLKRRRGIRWMLLGLMSKPFFQKPPAGTAAIMNRDGLDLTEQFLEITR